MEGIREIGRPSKRCREDVEEDLNIMGVKSGQAMFRDRRDCREGVIEAEVRSGLL
jgi:hypothetical protein